MYWRFKSSIYIKFTNIYQFKFTNIVIFPKSSFFCALISELPVAKDILAHAYTSLHDDSLFNYWLASQSIPSNISDLYTDKDGIECDSLFEMSNGCLCHYSVCCQQDICMKNINVFKSNYKKWTMIEGARTL